MPKKGNRAGREEKRRGKSVARSSRFGSKTVSEALHATPAKATVLAEVDETVLTPRRAGSQAYHERPWSHLVVKGPKTTSAVANAKARKLHHRKQRLEQDRLDAKRNGISVSELHFRKAAEARQIVANQRQIRAQSTLSRGDDLRRRLR